jgi:hypothetical protein
VYAKLEGFEYKIDLPNVIKTNPLNTAPASRAHSGPFLFPARPSDSLLDTFEALFVPSLTLALDLLLSVIRAVVRMQST